MGAMPASLHKHAEFALRQAFTNLIDVANEKSLCLLAGRRFNPKRGGVYFWITESGQAYVGKAKSFHSRLTQHLNNHPDIRWAFFKYVREEHRDAVERETISLADKHFPTRNIKHAEATVLHRPFDDLVPADERRQFLNGEELSLGQWMPMPRQHLKQQSNWRIYSASPEAEIAAVALKLFVERAIPKAAITEAAFWSVTARPSGHLLRVNVGQQEVFTVGEYGAGLSARILTSEPQEIFPGPPLYQTQSYVSEVSPKHLDAWFSSCRLLSSRKLVVRLMRQTQQLNSRSHCPQLVDHAFGLTRHLDV